MFDNSCLILLITNKHDLTTDFVVKALSEKGISFYRFNTEDLFKTVGFCYKLINGKIQAYLIDEVLKQKIDLKEVGSVYYRRPGIPQPCSEDISEHEKAYLTRENLRVLEGIYKLLDDAFWINPVWRIREAENKIWQLKIAVECGFTIPESLLSDNAVELERFRNRYTSTIVKPVSSGLVEESKDKSRVVFTSSLTEPIITEDVAETFLYIQEEVRKRADVRVTIVGESVFATLINSQATEEGTVDWRRSSIIPKHERYQMPKSEIDKCLRMMKLMELRYGAFDFILTPDDKLIFLELNPNGQWAWIENQTGYGIADAIVDLMINREN